ncbi:ABC transporter ATP-binding protein [Salinispira pacifica]|uniref:ABC transporter protein n=1 Tax=Salinispira pacifica TaxID=1307761 RepID=V5WJU6_9SPIO|nr:ABC transporter ATP-binding protein [Salinispira pacifica]AHC15935.1 ABC transporter protein [Salinispira pacifica]
MKSETSEERIQESANGGSTGYPDSPAVRVENVNKYYGSFHAVKNLNFQVGTGRCFGLLGPNGAGKTSMMKILYGKNQRSHSGENTVEVMGYDPDNHELEIKYLTGIVPQEDNLDVELTVLDNLLIYSRFYGMNRSQARSRIDELLEFMELGEKKGAKIRELSGGMKRRLIIARALINNPRLLILDEPTTGLDPQVRHHIWDKLRQLLNRGVTILITTHYMEEAFQLCDELAIMHKGEKILQGNPRSLIDENIERYVLEIHNMENVGDIQENDSVRKEQDNIRLLFYSNSHRELEKISETLNPGDYYLRQSNLEDLFLKSTGRALHE